jgi:hypothetical protein
MGSTSMLGANDPTGIYLNRLALLSPKQSIRLWEPQRQMLQEQRQTLGMVYVPTCLAGPQLV